MRYALIAVLLAGCATTPTPEQRAAEMEQYFDRIIAAYGPSCERLYHSNSSSEWANCVVTLAQKDEAALQTQRAYSAILWSRALNSAGQSFANRPTLAPAPQIQQPIRCVQNINVTTCE